MSRIYRAERLCLFLCGIGALLASGAEVLPPALVVLGLALMALAALLAALIYRRTA